MNNIIKKITDMREEILKGEIAALLHDIGKLNPKFLEKNSKENNCKFYHANIEEFLKKETIEKLKSPKLEIKINEKKIKMFSLIRYHHRETDLPSNEDKNLLGFLIKCDHKDSADDKGVVRRKQSIKNMKISSPFGSEKIRINLEMNRNMLEKLDIELEDSFEEYMCRKSSISDLRKNVYEKIIKPFHHALGETRIPANDVTLWDHSHSVASLYKTALCSYILNPDVDIDKLKWRIFGISWNSQRFIKTGKKIADIKSREEIINIIKKELARKFEDEIPIGNVIYEDRNEICFTFPIGSTEDIKELAKECSEKAFEVINKLSDKELSPFFILSKETKSMTLISDILEKFRKRRGILKSTPHLYIEDNCEIDTLQVKSNLDFADGKGICPICRIRPLKKDRTTCSICDERSSGRLKKWINREDESTIWISEIGDASNKIALISLNFNLDEWLKGYQITTHYSQTINEWNRVPLKRPTKNILSNRGINLNDKSAYEKVVTICNLIMKNASATEVPNLCKSFMAEGEPNIDLNSLSSPEDLSRYFFTKNPSPARLHRIWNETEEFFEDFIESVKIDFYHNDWKRIKFSASVQNVSFKENEVLIAHYKNLDPQELLLLHTENGTFYTIESLDKFTFINGDTKLLGIEAVKEAIKKEKFESLLSENERNLKEQNKKFNHPEEEEEPYKPLIILDRSPISLRMLVPAIDSIKILKRLTMIYEKRMAKVQGKLPLNISLLVSDRKFPLYELLDASERMLNSDYFDEYVQMYPWWDTAAQREDDFYLYYPVRKPRSGEEGSGFYLEDLERVSSGKLFYLLPGYFDFDMIGGNSDRYRINYERYDGSIRRTSEEYALFSGRPYFMYQFNEIVKLWDILKSNLSNSQIKFVEEALISKLNTWRNVNDESKKNVFSNYAFEILVDAFGKKWNRLKTEIKVHIKECASNGMLLDTISLFTHIINEKGDKNE